MQTTKILKTIDLAGQIAAGILPLAWGGSISRIGEGLFVLLFALGAWQFISCLVHLALRKEPWIAASRKAYNVMLLVCVILGLLAFIAPFVGFYVMYGMLFAGPALGIFYFWISLIEWLHVRRHSLQTLS